jgi:DNA-binding response OmpR family regulator
MTDRTEMPNPIRFGPFEVWSDTQTLRKNGTRLKLPTQAVEILLILLRNPGRVTTREELKQRLWPDVSCGDFDHGLNVAVNRLRRARRWATRRKIRASSRPCRGGDIASSAPSP